MYVVLLVILCSSTKLCLCYVHVDVGHLCPAGTFVFTTRSGLSFCHPCTDGDNFMSEWWHSHTTCNNCTQTRQPGLEILVSKCNRTHDAEILCRDGYYRRRARNVRENARCEKCFDCEYPTLSCQDYHDTVCCGAPNYKAVLNKDGVYVCQEFFCGPGQYLDIRAKQCSPCPPSTYISDDKHINTACNKCQTDLDLVTHQIIHPCNNTHPAIIGCKERYFTNSSHVSSWLDLICLPCRTCQREGRKCDMYHDTVCCPQAGMLVVDTETGPVCRSREQDYSTDSALSGENERRQEQTVCGEGQYLYSNLSTNTLTCRPCSLGTYMDEQNHRRTRCKSCSTVNFNHNIPPTCKSEQDIEVVEYEEISYEATDPLPGDIYNRGTYGGAKVMEKYILLLIINLII